MDENSAIGIFDSGVGGLTVLREVAGALPEESLVYFGDTARVPYGTKSPETVIRYAQACARVLLERDIKLLVVACNTASAFAMPALREAMDIPVIGVVTPGAQAAVARSKNRRIGIIGTAGTVASGAYPEAIAEIDPDAEVFSQACPLFVPLAEEGWLEGEIPEAIARKYLKNLLECRVDTLVLGCTHYPLLAKTIGVATGGRVALIDSAAATASVVRETLEAMQMRCAVPMLPRRRFLVSDAPASFEAVAARFLGAAPETVEWVDLAVTRQP